MAEAIQNLRDVAVLEEIRTNRAPVFGLRKLKDGSLHDFLMLSTWKRVGVSSEGNRAVRVMADVLALP